MTKFDKVIPPGSEGKVYASVDISHIKGPIEKHVDLATDDPNRPSARLSIRANVKTYVDARPADFLRFTVERGQSQTQELILTPAYEKPITLGAAAVDSELFVVSISKMAEEAGLPQYSLKVTLKQIAQIGTQNSNVRIALVGAPVKEFVIPINAVVRGAISATPRVVSFVIRTFPEEVVAVKSTAVHPAKDAASPAVASLEAGAKLRVISQKEEWYQVIAPGNKIGWVSKSMMKTSKESEVPGSQTVSINKSNGRQFKLLDFRSNLQQVKVEMEPGTKEGYSLKVSLLRFDSTKKGNVTGALTVKTDDADQPELSIPVYIIVS